MNEAIKDFKQKMGQSQRLQESEKQVYERQGKTMEAKFNELASTLEWKEK